MATPVGISPLIVIIGPTASGKTDLAIKLARECSGEIICADSRTIYKGMDIGTAKPTTAERAIVPHHGLDLVNPDERFTVVDFKVYALQKINEIRARGRMPFLVGGTGLYVDSVLFDYQFPEVDIDPERRRELEGKTIEELQNHCMKYNITLPKNDKNKLHLVSAILRNGVSYTKNEQPIANCIIVGITTKKENLRTRIALRSEHMFGEELYNEARMLGKKYSWECSAMTGNIYPIVKQYLDGTLTYSEALQKSIISDWRLAKRQMTWLKRNRHIVWCERDEAYTYITRQLAVRTKS